MPGDVGLQDLTLFILFMVSGFAELIKIQNIPAPTVFSDTLFGDS